MKNKNFYIWVIGCQQNEFEAARISFALRNLGFNETDLDHADLVIGIACAVRQTAVDRIYGNLRLWNNKQVIITGCMIDADKKKLAKLGAQYWDIAKPDDLADLLDVPSDKLALLLEKGRSASYSIPIMTGCNNFCSYCAVPYTRGREQSRKLKDVITDVKSILKNPDFKPGSEILLLGQNVNSYKLDEKDITEKKSGRNNFATLLESLNKIPGDFKIAFISNHPKDMSSDIISAVAKLSKVKKEIHLPVQSGSNKILKAMNRPYTKEQYLEIVQKIKKADPNIEITTDVIIGFPGETEDDFQETVKVFDQVGFKMAYINKYSPRQGTAAYALGDPIDWKEKQRRWHVLDEVLKSTMH